MSKLFSSKASAGAVNFSLLLLRVGFGVLLVLNHGWAKLSHFNTVKDKFPDPLHVGSTISLGMTVFAEVFCTVFVILGLLTRLATIPILILFGVALFMIHAHAPLADKEPAILFAIPFLVILFAGPGKVSLDHVVGK
jgi:putative oxidoreductase